MPTTQPTNPIHWSPDDWQKIFLYVGAFLGVLGSFVTLVLTPSIIKILNTVKEIRQNSVIREQQVTTLDQNVQSVHRDQQMAARSVEAIPDPMPLKPVPVTPNPQEQSPQKSKISGV